MARKPASFLGMAFRLSIVVIGSAGVAYVFVGPVVFSKAGAIALAFVMTPVIIGVIVQQYKLRKAEKGGIRFKQARSP